MCYFFKKRSETNCRGIVAFLGGEWPHENHIGEVFSLPFLQHWIRCSPLGSHNLLGLFTALFTFSYNLLLPGTSSSLMDVLVERAYVCMRHISPMPGKGLNMWLALKKCLLMGWDRMGWDLF